MTDVSTLLLERVAAARLTEHVGHVVRQVGLLVEATGPACAGVGDLCHISLPGRILPAEVVGLDGVRLLLLPYGETCGLRVGSRVTACDRPLSVDLGPALLGRVVDAFCQPLDGKGDIAGGERRPIRRRPAGPLARRGIDTVLETRIRAIDTLLTLGYGQRMAIMAGSGVGKSTLLGMLSRHCVADVIVVALIGERGREVLEFVENRPGADGMRNVVMMVATADEPALVREAAALTAMTIGEFFSDSGQAVLLIVDSLTRYAMARREIGLATGEPATSRGYTPSVFSSLACLLERCGAWAEGGSMTGLFTVLVEGDDVDDPVADSVRGIADGHIVLSRELAQRGHYPAIDVLASVSRLASGLVDDGAQVLMGACRQALGLLALNQDVLALGAYREGSQPALDAAIRVRPALDRFLQQATGEVCARDTALAALGAALDGGRP